MAASTTDQFVDTAPRPDGPYGQIILFGDSITENSFDTEPGFSYGAALSHAFKRRLDVINRGFSGYNTQHALAVLPSFMPTTAQASVKLLILCFGANDSCLPDDPTGHHVPVDTYCNNLTAIIESPEVQAHEPHILLVTPPPIDERQRILTDRAGGFTRLRRSVENTERYMKACKEVGSRLGVPVVDIWTSFLRHAGWTEGSVILGGPDMEINEEFNNLFSDGLHLTASGYKLVFEQVMRGIKLNYPSLDPEKINSCYPPWEVALKA